MQSAEPKHSFMQLIKYFWLKIALVTTVKESINLENFCYHLGDFEIKCLFSVTSVNSHLPKSD